MLAAACVLRAGLRALTGQPVPSAPTADTNATDGDARNKKNKAVKAKKAKAKQCKAEVADIEDAYQSLVPITLKQMNKDGIKPYTAASLTCAAPCKLLQGPEALARLAKAAAA